MINIDNNTPQNLLLRLKKELEETLDSYRKIASLRSKKIEQEREQIEVYLGILESKIEGIKLSPQNLKKIYKVISRKVKLGEKRNSHRKQQDQLEDRFLEIEKVLVNLISKRFKY